MVRTRLYDLFDIGMEYLLTTCSDNEDFDFDQFMEDLTREESETSAPSHSASTSASASGADVQYQSTAATSKEPLTHTQLGQPLLPQQPLQPQPLQSQVVQGKISDTAIGVVTLSTRALRAHTPRTPCKCIIVQLGRMLSTTITYTYEA